jgi:hypothetical protein
VLYCMLHISRTGNLDDFVGTDLHTSHSIISVLSDHPSIQPQQSYLTVKMYCSSLCTQETVVGWIPTQIITVLVHLAHLNGPIQPIGSNMFTPVRQNRESAEPRTEHGVWFGFGSASAQDRTPVTLLRTHITHYNTRDDWHGSS